MTKIIFKSLISILIVLLLALTAAQFITQCCASSAHSETTGKATFSKYKGSNVIEINPSEPASMQAQTWP